jgi:hypothetical protein
MSFLINSYRFGASASYDTDAQAFFDATGITDTTQKNAVNQLVLDLKGAGLWSKMKVIYPMVGGTASTHKWNLKDPRDLDAAFRITFNGGWTHDANGITANGINSNAGTNFIPDNHLSTYNTHLSVYSRTNNAQISFDLYANNLTKRMGVYIRYGSPQNFFGDLNSVALRLNVFQENSLGYYILSRTADNSLIGYKNGNSFGTVTTTEAVLLPQTQLLISENTGSRNYALFTIGNGLDATEQAALNTAVQAFQTTLSRNV